MSLISAYSIENSPAGFVKIGASGVEGFIDFPASNHLANQLVTQTVVGRVQVKAQRFSGSDSSASLLIAGTKPTVETVM
jgi:hypothetical protein